MTHIYVSPETLFYIHAAIIAAATAATAVTWNRWHMRRMLLREFKRQLEIDRKRREDGQDTYRFVREE